MVMGLRYTRNGQELMTLVQLRNDHQPITSPVPPRGITVKYVGCRSFADAANNYADYNQPDAETMTQGLR
jgi:hypothetical protein